MLQITPEFKVKKSKEEFAAAPIWQCLQWGLDDFRAALSHGIFGDMSNFITINSEDRVCTVCLAGAVMVERFQTNEPYLYVEIRDRLMALSDIATHGCHGRAFRIAGKGERWHELLMGEGYSVVQEVARHKDFVRYGEDPVAWERYIEKTIELLKAEGV